VISQIDLRCLVASFPETTRRTSALEARLRIGTGFHGKWYGSQQEHWLGWLVAKDCEARRSGIDPANIPAEKRWNWIMCSPAMIWLADCAGVDGEVLDLAECAAQRAALINDRDGHPHGKLVREVLPWPTLEPCLLRMPPLAREAADAEGHCAFDRLCDRRSEFRKLRQWL